MDFEGKEEMLWVLLLSIYIPVILAFLQYIKLRADNSINFTKIEPLSIPLRLAMFTFSPTLFMNLPFFHAISVLIFITGIYYWTRDSISVKPSQLGYLIHYLVVVCIYIIQTWRMILLNNWV